MTPPFTGDNGIWVHSTYCWIVSRSHIVDPDSAFQAVIPKRGEASLTPSYPFLPTLSTIQYTIQPCLPTELPPPVLSGSSRCHSKKFNLWRCLFHRHVTNNHIGSTNLFGKLFNHRDDFQFSYQWYHMKETFVGHKELAAQITT